MSERILKKQIKELQELVKIKDAVIAELKTLIRGQSNYWWTPGNVGINSDTIITTGSSGNDCVINLPEGFEVDQDKLNNK